MGMPTKKISLSFKKDRPSESQIDGQRAIQKTDSLVQLTVLEEYLGWSYNAVLTGLYFKLAADIWKATLKVEMASGPKVAYFTGVSLYQLVDTVHWYAAKAQISWHRDRYPVRVSKRKGANPSWRNS